MASSWTILANL